MKKMFQIFCVILTTIILILIAFSGLYIQRDPSVDIFEAINRKLILENEIRNFVVFDPSLVSATNKNGETPLFCLAGKGVVSLVDYFISQGSDVNQANYKGVTPLASACHSGYFEIAKLLLARGADPNIANEDGETPLHEIIMWCPEEFDLFKLVVENGGRLDILTNDGMSIVEFCRVRREDYADPKYTGSKKLQRRFLQSYDRLEIYILSESKTRSIQKQSAIF